MIIVFVRKALRRCSFTLKRYYYRIERTGVLRFYIAVTYYYHNGTLVVLNVQRHEDGAMSRDLRVGFQPFVDWQRFSRRSARYQNAYSHSRQLRQSRKFIVAINLSASATPLEWPESSSFFFPPLPLFSLCTKNQQTVQSRPAGLAQARHCAWSRRDSRERAPAKRGKKEKAKTCTRTREDPCHWPASVSPLYTQWHRLFISRSPHS